MAHFHIFCTDSCSCTATERFPYDNLSETNSVFNHVFIQKLLQNFKKPISYSQSR